MPPWIRKRFLNNSVLATLHAIHPNQLLSIAEMPILSFCACCCIRPRRPDVPRTRSMLSVMLLLVAGLWPLGAVGNDEQTLTLGIHPYLSHSNLHVRFTPLARLLSEQLGMPVAVRIGRDYEEHIREIGADRLDIAYLGPVSYVRMTGKFGSKPLLARLERKG